MEPLTESEQTLQWAPAPLTAATWLPCLPRLLSTHLQQLPVVERQILGVQGSPGRDVQYRVNTEAFSLVPQSLDLFPSYTLR